MKKLETSLPGVWELRPEVFRDARGFFVETYHQAKLAEIGITDVFVQDNHSRSSHGTLRGLHFQLEHPQAKLCRVVVGEALDVVADIRLGSPAFGKWTSVVLSATQHNQIYVPRGFAHGFLALSDQVEFLYKCSDSYRADDERGVLWNDPDLAIPWNVENPLVSDKDRKNPRLRDIAKIDLPVYRRE